MILETWTSPFSFLARGLTVTTTDSPRCTKTGRQRAASCSGISAEIALFLYTWSADEGFPQSLLSRDGEPGLHWDLVSRFLQIHGVNSLNVVHGL